eukprot:346204_1
MASEANRQKWRQRNPNRSGMPVYRDRLSNWPLLFYDKEAIMVNVTQMISRKENGTLKQTTTAIAVKMYGKMEPQPNFTVFASKFSEYLTEEPPDTKGSRGHHYCLAVPYEWYINNKYLFNIKNIKDRIHSSIEEYKRDVLGARGGAGGGAGGGTIIIDDENEIESENDMEKSSSPGWNCIQCTFKNKHLGNLCAMCDTPKPGSTVTKISDEQYAQLLHKSFEEGRDVSITPDIERIAIGSGPVQGGNNNNNNN